MSIGKLFSPRQLSQLIAVSENTLAAWRSRKIPTAPRFIKVGRSVRYRESDVAAWLDARESRFSTSTK